MCCAGEADRKRFNTHSGWQVFTAVNLQYSDWSGGLFKEEFAQKLIMKMPNMANISFCWVVSINSAMFPVIVSYLWHNSQMMLAEDFSQKYFKEELMYSWPWF